MDLLIVVYNFFCILQLCFKDDELDYTGVEQTLSFGPTVRRLCFNITILDDDVYEEQSDVFRVSLSSTYPVVSYGVQNATVYIVSSDREL